jgi:hypothetical protein
MAEFAILLRASAKCGGFGGVTESEVMHNYPPSAQRYADCVMRLPDADGISGPRGRDTPTPDPFQGSPRMATCRKYATAPATTPQRGGCPWSACGFGSRASLRRCEPGVGLHEHRATAHAQPSARLGGIAATVGHTSRWPRVDVATSLVATRPVATSSRWCERRRGHLHVMDGGGDRHPADPAVCRRTCGVKSASWPTGMLAISTRSGCW